MLRNRGPAINRSLPGAIDVRVRRVTGAELLLVLVLGTAHQAGILALAVGKGRSREVGVAGERAERGLLAGPAFQRHIFVAHVKRVVSELMEQHPGVEGVERVHPDWPAGFGNVAPGLRPLVPIRIDADISLHPAGAVVGDGELFDQELPIGAVEDQLEVSSRRSRKYTISLAVASHSTDATRLNPNRTFRRRTIRSWTAAGLAMMNG